MDGIAHKEYLRERLDPKPEDRFYLHLSDLLLAIRDLLPPNAAKVLDYGCGGSPYRPLFGECTYHRADMSGENLDFQFSPDATLPAELGGYDLVLSTQVLEHVEDPTTYLRECYRVLKPSGNLLLTTHGLFEEHPCPTDYWRWTSFGLHKIIEEAGLRVVRSRKITTGPRAAIFLAERQIDFLCSRPVGLYGYLLSSGIRTVRRAGWRPLHVTSDAMFEKNRIVHSDETGFGHEIFIAIGILATK